VPAIAPRLRGSMFETAINARCRRSRKRALSPQINSLAPSGFLVPDISGASHLIRAGYPLDALGSVSPPAFGGRVRPKEAQMLGKLSIAGAVAAILMNPTARSAQVGGAVNPGAAVRGRSGDPDPAVQTSRPLSPHQNGGEAFLHVRLPFSQSSSASRFTARACRFLNLSQSPVRPER
jgi:hypothetical protein